MSIIDEYRVTRTTPDPEDVCPECEDCGWIMSSYQEIGAPRFEECPRCYNPERYPHP